MKPIQKIGGDIVSGIKEKIYPQQFPSAGTSRNQVAAFFKSKLFATKKGETNADLGGGAYDMGTNYLKKEKGITNVVVDPHNRTKAHNAAVLRNLASKKGAESSTTLNTLNVIKEPEARKQLIEQAYAVTKPNSKSYYQIFEGNKSGVGKQTGPEQWQNNLKTEEYVPEIESVFGVGNVKRRGNYIIATKTAGVAGATAVAGAAQAEEDLNPHIEWDKIATAPEDQVFKYKYNLPDGSTLGQVAIPGGYTKQELDQDLKEFLEEQAAAEDDKREGFFANLSAPGETLRAGIISLLEAKGLEVTRENIEQVWNDADTLEKSSFMELFDRQFENWALAPEGTINPLLQWYARNPELRAGSTVFTGLLGDLVLDPINLAGGTLFVQGAKLLKQADIKTTGGKGAAFLRKRRLNKANKIIERITKRRDELVAKESMNPEAAMRVAYNEYDLQHGFLNQIRNISDAEDIAKIDPLLKTIPRYPGTITIKEGKLVTEHRIKTIVNTYNKRRELNRLRTATNDILEGTKDVLFRKGLDKFVSPVITRLYNISPVLADKMVKLEFNTAKSMREDLDEISVWLEHFRDLPKQTKTRLTQHLNNGEFDKARELMRIISKGMDVEFDTKILPFLDKKFGQLDSTGKINKKENYFPRLVKERAELNLKLDKIKQGEIGAPVEMVHGLRKIIADKELQYKRDLSDTEIGDLANSWFLRPENEKIIRKLGFEKRRVIKEITGDLIKHYDTADQALTAYLTRVNHQFHIRNFLGKRVDNTELLDEDIIQDSIGNLVARLEKEGELRAGASTEIRDLLRARFIGGERGSDYWIQKARDFGYITTLGNPHSALTQLGDIGTSLFLHGAWNTSTAIVKTLTGKNPVKYSDFGTDVMAELTHAGAINSFSRKTLDFSLRKGGFRAIDMLGKNVNINASLTKWSKMSKSPKLEANFRARFKNSYSDIELDKLVDDFKNFENSGAVTSDMNYVTFTELLDAQPIALSSLPEAYLANPNGRLWYQLKTFALKQVDLVRRTIVKKASQGDLVGATADAMRYSIMVGGTNTASTALKDTIRDVLSGDKEALDTFEETLDNDPYLVKEIAKNTIKVMGFDPDRAGYGEAVSFTPAPFDVGAGIVADVADADLANTLKYVPIVGRWLYYYIDSEETSRGFGGGTQRGFKGGF